MDHFAVRSLIVLLLLVCHALITSGQICTDSVDIQQSGDHQLGLGNSGRLAITPRLNFTCDGRITHIRARVNRDNRKDGFPSFQVWRPTSTGSMIYNRIGEVQLPSNGQVIRGSNNLWETNIVLTGGDRIEFQSGDVIGYFHPSNSRYQVRSIRKIGYVLYGFDQPPFPTLVDLSVHPDNRIFHHWQPLIQFTVDIRCGNLSTSSNGETSCSSGRVGVGYEGDTCSITCNTGYELTGSDTRTCQSDGNWNGSDDVCRRVHCPSLTSLNGTYRCNLGSDGVTSYEDICHLVCNTGYELIGGDTRTCQSDGSWSGSDDMCRRVHCHTLLNGALQCPNEATTGMFEDTCTFSCNRGYELQGSNSGTCLANQSWSGGDPICVVLNCSTSPPLDNSQLKSPCDTQYQSTCTTVCVDGYNGVGGSYRCVVTHVGNNSVGWSGQTFCARVQCSELFSPTDGKISCSLESDRIHSYEDTCNFTCNTGYELTGSPQRTCQSVDSWSGSPVSCIIMECPSSSLPMNSMLAESCSSTYQSICDLQCEEGFSGSGDPCHVCEVEGTSVKWRSMGRCFDCVSTASSDGGGSDGIVYAVIGAAGGGSAVFIVLTLLCILVLVVRWSYKRHGNNENTKDSVVCNYRELDTNPSNTANTIKMDYNPSYGIIDKHGNAVKMDSNPSYDVTDLSCDAEKLKRKTSENHYSYVEPTEAPLSHHRDDTVKMESNPSYQSTTRYGKTCVMADLKRKTSEEQYNYVEPDEIYHKEDTVKVETNPPCNS